MIGRLAQETLMGFDRVNHYKIKVKTYQFKVSVKDDNYDASKIANIKNFEADKILPSGL
jgi:hypothetical protein